MMGEPRNEVAPAPSGATGKEATAARGGLLELLLADGRTPTGSFADSGGLEPLLGELAGEGVSEAALAGFVQARLATVGWCEAAVAVRAARTDDLDGLLALELQWAARCPSQALRAASARVGFGLLRTARAWWPEAEPLGAYARGSALTPRAVALGSAARAGGLGDPRRLARLSLYDDAATVLAAASKLLPLDSTVAGRVVLALAGELERLAQRAAASGAGVGELPSASAPLLEIRAERHSRLQGRLFAS